ncbi:DUF6011 domain-containing protein [Streptomyces sp. ICBB 8177]|uniref:DUF6011 domain-containing protein n=1 Tax=Streptomyces sp. ICBB 8177 TaxID=563922 RepID=UPI000D6724A1|nr:DUF6011 domain-containing protein [Streptomyces sp. ICBB 8177]PWI44549.1 hypothetical protein CK485_15290 [Streptomyces sp. ICBB 8177]
MPYGEGADDAEPRAEGRRRVTCRVCGRPLHGRQARLWGLGDDCRAKLAQRTAPRPPAHEADQDPLPGL